MGYFDLSHLLRPGIPLYPGTPLPALEKDSVLERDGCRVSSFRCTSHVGTHVDAPAHMLLHGRTLDALPPEQFAGVGCVADCSGLPLGSAIPPELLRQAYRPGAEFVLLYTGQARLWPEETYLRPNTFLSPEAARWLSSLPLKGVGIDNFSVDPVDAEAYPAHTLLLGAGMVIYENLRGLEALVGRTFELFGFPVLYEDADGVPVRVVARSD